jgi:hypothetical protein
MNKMESFEFQIMNDSVAWTKRAMGNDYPFIFAYLNCGS